MIQQRSTTAAVEIKRPIHKDAGEDKNLIQQCLD